MPKNHSFRCWVPHCINSRKRTRKPNSHFHAFPVKNPERCRRWLQAVGYEDLVYLPLHSLRIRYVCSEHFTDEDYGKHSTNANLFYTAIPSKFPSGTTPLSDEILSEWPPKLASDRNNSHENLGKTDHVPATLPHSIDIASSPSAAQMLVKDDTTMDSESEAASLDAPVQAIDSVDKRLPPLPQELLMSYLKDSSGKGLYNGDILLGFVVQRGTTLDIVPVGPNHSMVVSSGNEEHTLCPVSSSNGVENVRCS